ncbi:polymer-forming cytoskeletal protein [Halomontanus rarus]|uniref:polymer-forming cytoskeletal protein n=1 Tax=Halomontanus rarus TaxID=3034020 RepID=UPI001A97FE43
MAFSRDPLDELLVPDGTSAQERDLVTDGDVLVGARSTVEFGVRGRNVLAGEGVRFGGAIEAEGDCRLDMWCDVEKNVLVGEDAYLGERVHVGGELKVAGDLDIGDDVEIEDGFEANGWIVIRNPMPTIVLLFVYLKHLLLVGEEDTAQALVSQLTDEGERAGESEGDEDGDGDGDGGELADPLIVPRNATVNDSAWRVSTPATIGDDCRLHGNVRAETIDVGERNNIFGSLRARGDITVGAETRIHGDVTTRDGSVTLGPDARVLGDVSCGDLELGPDAEVDGTMRADGEITMQTTQRERE